MVEDSSSLLREYPLSESLVVSLNDETGHYFGGYYHVRLVVRCTVPLQEEMFASIGEFEAVCAALGQNVCFERVLEKMAVPVHELDLVKNALLQAFEMNLLPYLKHSGFAHGFVKKQYYSYVKKSPTYRK